MSQIEVGDHLYTVNLKFTQVVEYGVSMEALMSGQAPPPPQGARFDVYFEGTCTGEKLNGAITGVDYLYVRADGRFELNVRAQFTAPDGQTAAITAGGVAAPRADSPIAELRENVTLFTACQDYLWVNGLQVWGVGTVNLADQAVEIKGYAA